MDLLQDQTVVTGKEVVQRIKKQEKDQKEFAEALEFEIRNSRGNGPKKGEQL